MNEPKDELSPTEVFHSWKKSDASLIAGDRVIGSLAITSDSRIVIDRNYLTEEMLACGLNSSEIMVDTADRVLRTMAKALDWAEIFVNQMNALQVNNPVSAGCRNETFSIAVEDFKNLLKVYAESKAKTTPPSSVWIRLQRNLASMKSLLLQMDLLQDKNVIRYEFTDESLVRFNAERSDTYKLVEELDIVFGGQKTAMVSLPAATVTKVKSDLSVMINRAQNNADLYNNNDRTIPEVCAKLDEELLSAHSSLCGLDLALLEL